MFKRLKEHRERAESKIAVQLRERELRELRLMHENFKRDGKPLHRQLLEEENPWLLDEEA